MIQKQNIQHKLVGFAEKEFKSIVSRAGLAQAFFYVLAVTSLVGGAITFA